jgi:hypothetical protein
MRGRRVHCHLCDHMLGLLIIVLPTGRRAIAAP